VRYQLRHAPELRGGLYRRGTGTIFRVSTVEETPGDDLLEEQEGQGYGEDEGERDDALENDTAA
jgi:hypothetical protein